MLKYLLFDQNAINVYINTWTLQSIAYSQGCQFVRHLRGQASSELFENTVIEHVDNGVLFVGRPSSEPDRSRAKRIFCINLQTCNILAESDDGVLLTIVQKVFRTCVKIWNRQPFSNSERIYETKSIVFPFAISDKRRIVIERSSSILEMDQLKNRGIEFPLLAYKYSDEEPSSVEEKINTQILKTAGKLYATKYYELQQKFEVPSEEKHAKDTSALVQIRANTAVERDDFIFWPYAKQMDSLTSAQRSVVESAVLNAPIRIDGAAGTGKTMSLIMRAYHLLLDMKRQSKSYKIIFLAHSISTCQRNRSVFELYPESDYFMNPDSPQHIIFATLLSFCAEFVNIPLDIVVEKDAGDAKTYQLLLIEGIVQEAKRSNEIRTLRHLLSPELYDLFDEEKTATNVLCAMLQHEFSIQIKGRTDCLIDSYYDLPPIPNGLPCKSKADKEFIFSLFCRYQDALRSTGSFDVDDITLEALSHLNAPVWRRNRIEAGYDYIIADEMHLFNINEQSIFHYLTRDPGQKDIPICFALDRSQAIGDRGDVSNDYAETAFGKVVRNNYNTVFRNSPQIERLCASIAASGTLMFHEHFVDPYCKTHCVFTQEEEEKSTQPILHLYNNDEDMVASLRNHVDNIVHHLQCKPSEIVIISFEPTLLSDKGVETISSILHRQCVLLDTNQTNQLHLLKGGDVILSSPYAINGLEFKAVILVGVDEGRVPQTSGTSDISEHFIKYSAFNLLYLAASRAKYELIMLGNNLKGRSSCLDHSIASGYISIESH